MTTKTKKNKKQNKLAKAKAIVKKINNDLIDASFEAIETTVKTGEKWQKRTAKLIKKAEPLTSQQINMFVDTAESLKAQLEEGKERLKTLVKYDSKLVEQAKKVVTEHPLVEKAEEFSDKIQKEVTNNKLVKKAEKMSQKISKKITNTIEEVKEKIEDYTEEAVEETVKAKKTATKKVAKKTKTVKKAVVKKTPAKKVTIKKSDTKDDLKVIKGIGPKLEETLNNIGITAYEQLASSTIKDVTTVLTNAGVNTKIYDISGWKSQAKLAMKGDMESLANWEKK